ncbi:MAG: L-threonylcarbamoyladenylate synthase [Bacteroidia bacterium]
MAEIGTDVFKAAEWLKHGLVGMPTETVYGLAGNALDPERLVDIFEVKNRPFFDPLIVHVPTIESLSSLIAHFPPVLKVLAEHFWPGPLTLLLPRSDKIPDLVTSGLPEAAFRVPAHPMALALLHECTFPLAAPSANPFGYISPTTAQHVNDQLGAAIPYILDGGSCRVGLESTIVGLLDGTPTVFRLGGLSIADIEAVIGPVNINTNTSSNPRAPGALKSHYAPSKPLLFGKIDSLLETHRNSNPLLLVFGPLKQGYPAERQLSLSLTYDLKEAAARLFAMLREADTMDASLILAEELPAQGLGLAINDRLRRAAASDEDNAR